MKHAIFKFSAVAALLIGGCGEDESPSRQFIAPLDGQTQYPLDLPIRITSSEIDIPDDYPTPDLIRVTNADNGLPVPGAISMDAKGVTFTPNDPWRPNRRYIWTVDPPESVPHGPDLIFPEHLVGTAVFDTTPRLKMLNGGVDSDGRTCMVFSRPIQDGSDSGTLKLTVNDVVIEDAIFSLLGAEDLGPGYDLDPKDPGVSVVCVTTSVSIAAGASLRLWWGNNGPWRVDLIAATPDELVEQLRWSDN